MLIEMISNQPLALLRFTWAAFGRGKSTLRGQDVLDGGKIDLSSEGV